LQDSGHDLGLPPASGSPRRTNPRPPAVATTVERRRNLKIPQMLGIGQLYWFK
jgi:hypothetical protein